MAEDTQSLVKLFNQYFDLTLAKNKHQLESVYRIRGDVYCKEFQFEPIENCPGGLEQDDYDESAIHCLITLRESQFPAGCIRIIFNVEHDPLFELPFEKHCSQSLLDHDFHPENLERSDIAELSRFAVHPLFRRTTWNKALLGNQRKSCTFSKNESNVFPLLSTVLALAPINIVETLERQHCYAMMEPRLSRLLKRVGIEFTQVGEIIDYHGLRAAFHITRESGLRNLKKSVIELYHYVTECIDYELNQVDLHRFSKPKKIIQPTAFNAPLHTINPQSCWLKSEFLPEHLAPCAIA